MYVLSDRMFSISASNSGDAPSVEVINGSPAMVEAGSSIFDMFKPRWWLKQSFSC